MAYSATFAEGRLAPEASRKIEGWLLLEFGTNWCGHCAAAQPALEEALAEHPGLTHIKEEDGPGRKLGRYFHVKLWPTLILIHDGEEVGRLIRPTRVEPVRELLSKIG